MAVAAAIAFGAGRRWKHFTRTCTDYRKARETAREFRAERWVALRVAVVFTAALLIYLLATGFVTIHVGG